MGCAKRPTRLPNCTKKLYKKKTSWNFSATLYQPLITPVPSQYPDESRGLAREPTNSHSARRLTRRVNDEYDRQNVVFLRCPGSFNDCRALKPQAIWSMVLERPVDLRKSYDNRGAQNDRFWLKSVLVGCQLNAPMIVQRSLIGRLATSQEVVRQWSSHGWQTLTYLTMAPFKRRFFEENSEKEGGDFYRVRNEINNRVFQSFSIFL